MTNTVHTHFLFSAIAGIAISFNISHCSLFLWGHCSMPAVQTPNKYKLLRFGNNWLSHWQFIDHQRTGWSSRRLFCIKTSAVIYLNWLGVMPSTGAKSFQTNTSSCTTELEKLKAMILTVVLGFIMTIFVENIA